MRDAGTPASIKVRRQAIESLPPLKATMILS
jgi:hypothetical protein